MMRTRYPNAGLSAATLAVAVFCLAALCALGCSKKTGSHDTAATGAPSVDTPQAVKLAFVTNNAAEFWKIAAAGIKKYEQESGVQVDLKMPPNGTTEEQNQILENLSSQGYDSIAVSVIAPNDQLAVLNRVASKTKLITFDSDAPSSSRLLYIGTNNYEAGKMLGGEILKLLPNGGNIAVFVGSFAADNATQRLKGIQDVIFGHKIELVDKREDNKDPATARRNPEEVLTAHKDLNLLVGLWSYNGPAISAALESLGKKGKVQAAVFDEEDGTLSGIESGTVACTVVQKPFQFGYLSSKWMHDLATKGPAALARIPTGKVVDTGVDVINQANVAAFKSKLAELKK